MYVVNTDDILHVTLTEAILQQVRELGVAVRHMGLLALNGCHHIPQREQTAVDVLGLLQT